MKDHGLLRRVAGRSAGTQVPVTHPDKVVFPFGGPAGVTKLDLIDYYLAVADGALRGVAGRPMILKRFVKGIDQEAVFQKRAPEKRPDCDRRRRAELRVGDLGQGGGASTTPPAWLGGQPRLRRPQPAPGAGRRPRPPRRTARRPRSDARRRLARRSSTSPGRARGARGPRAGGWPKTSGSRGFHIYARIHRAGRSSRCGWPPRRWPARSSAARRSRRPPLVEGGTRRRVRRLQPERQGPHRRVGVLGARHPGRPGVDAAALGRGRRLPARGVHRRDRARSGSPSSATRGRAWTTPPAAWTRCSTWPRSSGPPRRRPKGARRSDGGRAAPSVHDAAHRDRPHQDQGRGDGRAGQWRETLSRGGRAAARRRPRRRHARAEFDLVPHPDQPAARARGRSARRRRTCSPTTALGRPTPVRSSSDELTPSYRRVC